MYYIEGEKRMTVDEMVKIVGAFMTHCPDSYKMYIHSYVLTLVKGIGCAVLETNLSQRRKTKRKRKMKRKTPEKTHQQLS